MKTEQPIKGVKGFDLEMKCRGMQYAPNTTVTHNGTVKACERGIHFCEYPLDVLNYYAPNSSKYFEVEGSGEIDKEIMGDSKIACSTLKIGIELSLTKLVQAAVKFTFDRAKWNKENENIGNATGNQGAASATGDRGAASATGDQSIAIAAGIESKAKASLGNWIVCSQWGTIKDKYERINVQSAKVDGKKIKADTYYTLQNGKLIEVK